MISEIYCHGFRERENESEVKGRKREREKVQDTIIYRVSSLKEKFK